MRKFLTLLMVGLLVLTAGCATAPQKERPKVLCPACGSEIDAVIHKHF